VGVVRMEGMLRERTALKMCWDRRIPLWRKYLLAHCWQSV
jgi:hypothetical protein